MAIKLADTARPNNYVDAEHLGTFPVAFAEDVWFADGTRLSEKTFDGQSIQKEELPLASVDELGKIYQYIGVDGTYLNGHFYKCANDAGYYWKEIEFVNNPVVYSETEPVIQDYKNGAVVVYDGEDGLFYKKGHHYKKVRHSVYMYDWRTNGTDYLTSDSELSVGTVLYGVDPSYNISPLYIITDLDYQGSDIRAESIISSTDYFADDVTQLSDAGTTLITEFVDIGGGGSGQDAPKVFNGTKDNWDLLSTEQKKEYDYANFTDDSNEGEGAIVGFYGISGDLLSETHQCDGEEVEYTYTVPEDGYYAVTYDMSATTQTTQYCVAKMRGGNGILYTYDTTVSAPYRILARKFLPYLKTGSTIAIAHGGSYGQATVKINRIIYN